MDPPFYDGLASECLGDQIGLQQHVTKPGGGHLAAPSSLFSLSSSQRRAPTLLRQDRGFWSCFLTSSRSSGSRPPVQLKYDRLVTLSEEKQ